MDAMIGFLSGGPAYSVTVPDEIAGSQEACSTVRAGGVFKSLQWADETAGAKMIEQAGLYENGSRTSAAANVTVYGQDAPGELEHIILMFSPTTPTIAFGRLWLTLEADEEQLVDTFVEHLAPYQDRYGIARVRVNGPVMLGSPLNPIERDIVSFFGPPIPYNVQALQFSNTGTLGTDRGLFTDGTSSATVATPFGVSVTCQGGDAARSGLQARADAVATSLRRL